MGAKFQTVVRLVLLLALISTCIITVKVMHNLSYSYPGSSPSGKAAIAGSSGSRIRIPPNVLRLAAEKHQQTQIAKGILAQDDDDDDDNNEEEGGGEESIGTESEEATGITSKSTSASASSEVTTGLKKKKTKTSPHRQKITEKDVEKMLEEARIARLGIGGQGGKGIRGNTASGASTATSTIKQRITNRIASRLKRGKSDTEQEILNGGKAEVPTTMKKNTHKLVPEKEDDDTLPDSWDTVEEKEEEEKKMKAGNHEQQPPPQRSSSSSSSSSSSLTTTLLKPDIANVINVKDDEPPRTQHNSALEPATIPAEQEEDEKQNQDSRNDVPSKDTSTAITSSSSISTSNNNNYNNPMDLFVGSSEDLQHHKGNEACWNHFDFGFLQSWDATSSVFCSPRGGSAPVSDAHSLSPRFNNKPTSSSWLRCRVTVDGHLPPATAPHTMCDGANIIIDSRFVQPISCLASRPGYKCDGPPIHYAFNYGALGGNCDRSNSFQMGAFPRDHLMDMFNGFRETKKPMKTTSQPVLFVEEDQQEQGNDGTSFASSFRTTGDVVLVISRERAEHANPFHATTDFLNAFFTLHTAGVIDGMTGSRKGMEKVQVLLMDEQIGPFEAEYVKRVFSPSHPLLRMSQLLPDAISGSIRSSSSGGEGGGIVVEDGGGAGEGIISDSSSSRLLPPIVRLPHALFVPPGYTNMLLAHVATEGECHAGTHLFQSFRRFVLQAFELSHLVAHGGHHDDDDSSTGGRGKEEEIEEPIVVTLVSRRPYTSYVEHTYIGRQFDNEEELLPAMRSIPGVLVTRSDFALMAVPEQIEQIARTEVLVGMHGAALTHALYMPHHGAVVELWPKDRDMWRCFEHISAMAGLHYLRWENTDPTAFRADVNGDYTRVNIPQFLELFAAAVKGARERRGTRIETRGEKAGGEHIRFVRK